MASSRSMRSSRVETPLSAPPKDMVSIKNEDALTKTDASSSTEWQEPPLRPPAPSFEDYKGLERQGVLEYMQPLGTFPSQRVRLRLKAHDPPPKRTKHARNGEHAAAGRAGTEDMSTPDPAPAPSSRRSESHKSDDRASRHLSSRGKNEDSEYRPNGMSSTPSKAVPSHSPQHGTPSSRTSTGHAKLSEIVESAVQQATQLSDAMLGLALRKLYKESIQNHELADLLNAVLQKDASDQQKSAFRKYVKRARKEVIAETSLPQASSETERASSEAKRTSPANNGRIDSSKPRANGDVPEAPKNHDNKKKPTSHPHSPTKSNRQNAKSFSSEASSPKHQPPSNRAKRSNSTSSLSSVASSLSSVDPNIALKTEEDLAAADIPLPSSSAMTKAGKTKAAVGPKMGTFVTSNKRPLAAPQMSKEDEEFAAKRRKLTKTFPDYVVKDSDVRTRIQQSIEHDSAHHPSLPALQHPRQQSSQLRGGTERSAAGDDSDQLDSPATSMQSELLIPPPPFAGSSRRGVTPTNLGRPPRAGKKSARVKMS
ncbi:MAG: hypothetical protein LQ338_000260 [Usnochroma carphineum]|nr:MAG: hypothetical protein LQ338_000260 [Usnochroma carphineum]